MIEKATVITINNDIVSLACGDSAGCGECAAHGICGGAQDRKFDAWNASKIDLNTGDRVEVLLPTGKTIGSAFMVMIFPLLLFFLFFYAATLVIENPSEGVQVLFGLIGIAVGFGLNFLLNRNPKKKSMPEIIRKLD
ncbi:MAG: SoxR reducing system RseC family protein [Spirochaetales bacterium]|nr:SoxR reducing system RseC family protein [Spirochaetales bacterium]